MTPYPTYFAHVAKTNSLKCSGQVAQGQRQLKEQFSTWQVLPFSLFSSVKVVKPPFLSSRGNSRRNSPHSRPGSPPRQTRVFRRAGSPRFTSTPLFSTFQVHVFTCKLSQFNAAFPGALEGEALCQEPLHLLTLTGVLSFCLKKNHFPP